MVVTTQVPCPVCGEQHTEAICTANPYSQLFTCRACGHVFAPNSAITSEENRRLQLDYFGEAFAGRSGFFISLYERLNAQRVVRVVGCIPRLRVLEIGPGSGVVMAHLSKCGHEVRGLDVSPAVAKQIGQRWDFPVIVQPLDAHVREASGSYDMVIMRHVLEHFADPYGALCDVYALLKPKGRLYIAVPNMASWHRPFRGWLGYEPYHLQYFNEHSLTHALVRAGFRIVRVASYESLSGWVNTLAGSISGKRKHGEGDILGKNGWTRKALETVRLAIGAMLSPVRWLQSSLRRGEELVVLAEKAVS